MSEENASPNNLFKSTPPTNRKVRNPFDKALIGRLHKPLCSPGMCKVYKKQSNGLFRWDIDQACSLVPEDIVPCSSQFEPSPDPALDKILEEATDKFFSQEMVMPSPLESSKKVKPLLTSSYNASVEICCVKESVVMRNASAQTTLTLPPELPPQLEKLLASFCTFTVDQNISGDYEITANGSLCRKLLFEEHSDVDHYDSEQTDDENHVEKRPPSSYEAHTPVVFSPDHMLCQDLASKGLKRTFGTPLKSAPVYRNKIFDTVDSEPCFSPIQFTPKREALATPTSIASASISPVKISSSDEEKNNFTSPESEVMATCLDCVAPDKENIQKRRCFCKSTPDKLILKRSASLKEDNTSPRRKTFSFSGKRSLSMSSLHRSRSVQKLDFSMDMSVDGSLLDHSQADSESSPSAKQVAWSLEHESSGHPMMTPDAYHSAQSFKTPRDQHILDDTPVKGKRISTIFTHEISKIRTPKTAPQLHMSLDNIDDLNLEHKKVDFNNVDLKFLTENVSQFDYTKGGDSSTSFKRVDSGFNENTFYNNASSYYESAIKPSELTVTNINTGALKEISNVNWMRVDSGFNENSGDSVMYPLSETSKKPEYRFSEPKFDDKENDYDRFLVQSNKNEAMSMSDIFNDDMTFNCNFSSTPSKNKPRSF